MKLTLIIEADRNVIMSVIAGLPEGVAVAMTGGPNIPPMPASPGPSDEDGDEGAPNIAPPAVDSAGMPWDARIHSSGKTVTAKGEWRKIKNIDPELVKSVEAQVRAGGTPPQPAPMPAPPMPASAPAPAPAPLAAPQPAPMPVPAPAPAPAPAPMPAPPMPATATAPDQYDFAQFMQHLSGQMAKRDAENNPLVHAVYLAGITAEIAQAFNTPVAAITDIAANPQMITFAIQAMQRDGRW